LKKSLITVYTKDTIAYKHANKIDMQTFKNPLLAEKYELKMNSKLSRKGSINQLKCGTSTVIIVHEFSEAFAKLHSKNLSLIESILTGK